MDIIADDDDAFVCIQCGGRNSRVKGEKVKKICTYLAILLFATTAWSYEAKVVNVTDGDTIKVIKKEGAEVKIRLYGIDCPEKKQAFGNAATKQTAFYVAGRMVDIEAVSQDQYGRTIGMVTFDGKNLSEELIRTGYAWVYQKYCKQQPECSGWLILESDSQKNRKGLWDNPNPKPPWEWRKGK